MSRYVTHLQVVDRAVEICRARGVDYADDANIGAWRQAMSEATLELLGAVGADTARTPL